MTTIEREILTKGVAVVTLFDAIDLPLWDSRTWFLNEHGYVRCNASRGRWPRERFHRAVLGLGRAQPGDMVVDHINGNRADNRRCNLRLANRFVNAANRFADRDASHPEVGVHFDKSRGRWAARRGHQGKTYVLYFATEAEAVAAALGMRWDLRAEVWGSD